MAGIDLLLFLKDEGLRMVVLGPRVATRQGMCIVPAQI